MKDITPDVAVHWTTDDSSLRSWIEKNPGVCGGDACIRAMRIPVWSVVQSLKLGVSEAEVLRALPSLTPDDLQVARRYYEEHAEEIDTAIRLNEEA